MAARPPSGPEVADVAIVGGGIAGLAAAWALVRETARAPPRVVVLEQARRLGGNVRTERLGPYLFEGGPDVMVSTKPAGVALCRELGLADELVAATPGAIGIVHRGRVVGLPDGPVLVAPTRSGPLLRSRLLSPMGKLRLLAERLVPVRRGAGDESVESFVRRRFGREAYERLAEPLLGGLFAADARTLSAARALPQLVALERSGTSVARGLRERQVSPGPQQVSLRSGLGSLIDALARALPAGAVRTGVEVVAVGRCAGAEGGFELRLGEGNATNEGGATSLSARQVVLAAPAPACAELVRGLDSELAAALSRLEFNSCVTVTLAYRRVDLPRPPRGNGFFVPRSAGLAVLAASYPSEKLPGRAPATELLVRVFLGGALAPRLAMAEDGELVALARGALEQVLGVAAAPLVERVERFVRAMPSLAVGCQGEVERCAALAARHPGLQLCGGALAAYGLPDCIASAERAAAAIRAAAP